MLRLFHNLSIKSMTLLTPWSKSQGKECVCVCGGEMFSDVKAKISHPSKWNMLNRTQKCMFSFFFPALYLKNFVLGLCYTSCMYAWHLYTSWYPVLCSTLSQISHFTSLCKTPALGYKSCSLVAHDWGGAVAR